MENRKYAITIYLENESDTLADGLQQAKKTIEGMCLKVHDIKPVQSQRTIAQNNALHLFFTQLCDEMLNHGIDMKTILKEGFEFTPTPFAIKEYVWKPTQKALFGKKSTTQLYKTGEIEKVYDVINRAITERTKGEISLPKWPSIETLMEENL